MNRQEVLRVNHSVFVAYVFPGVLWTSLWTDGTGTFRSRRRLKFQLRLKKLLQ